MDITVKEVRALEDMLACTELQKDAWGFEDIDCVPNHIYVALMHAGGGLFAAYLNGEKNPIGFTLLVPGFGNKGDKQSIMHMVAVSSKYQNRDISRALAKKAIEWAKDNNVKKISWTYDPLQGTNANAYFNKFGATVKTYKLDLYGNVSGHKNNGLKTDRFEAELQVNSERTNRIGNKYKAKFNPEIKIINSISYENNLEIPREADFNITDSQVYIRIPADFSQILTKSPSLANKWRDTTRAIFDEYINKRCYEVTEFVTTDNGAGRENYYLLERDAKGLIAFLLKSGYVNQAAIVAKTLICSKSKTG